MMAFGVLLAAVMVPGSDGVLTTRQPRPRRWPPSSRGRRQRLWRGGGLPSWCRWWRPPLRRRCWPPNRPNCRISFYLGPSRKGAKSRVSCIGRPRGPARKRRRQERMHCSDNTPLGWDPRSLLPGEQRRRPPQQNGELERKRKRKADPGPKLPRMRPGFSRIGCLAVSAPLFRRI